ncbi:protein of unknown function [Paraburkholderia kururiensis]
MFLGGQLRLEGTDEPVFLGSPARLDLFPETGRQVYQRLPAIGRVGLATDSPHRLQTGYRDAHGLRTHALCPGESGDGCGPVTIQTKKNRLLGGGEVARMRLLAQPSNQFAQRNAQLASQSGQLGSLGRVCLLYHEAMVACLQFICTY